MNAVWQGAPTEDFERAARSWYRTLGPEHWYDYNTVNPTDGHVPATVWSANPHPDAPSKQDLRSILAATHSCLNPTAYGAPPTAATIGGRNEMARCVPLGPPLPG